MDRHDPDCLLHIQFDQQAQRTPDDVALSFRDGSITFGALRMRSDRLASTLRTVGIADGASVGLHAERSIDYVVGVLAILKANCAVVPLPPSYPAQRLRDILQFAALDAVVDDGETPLTPSLGQRVVHVTDVSEASSHARPGGASNEDQPAFVLCSSGSTGSPKMIVRSHRSFFHRLRWTWENHPYSPGEVCCQKSHMTSTHAIYELFEPLLRGVAVVIIPDEEARTLERFWETIRVRAVSRLLIIPSALQAALDMPDFVSPRLKVLVLMGEYVHPELARRAIEAFAEPTRIYSIYGSTEASSTLVCDLRESYKPNQDLPLGAPISPEVQARVLNEALEPVARGDTGVLYIGGAALFSGYFRNAELTASVIARAPDGVTLYNTHDQVRVLHSGDLQFVGRIDHTVKVRGFRVDLGEVERALAQQPGISRAAVLLSEPGSGAGILVAFVAPETVDRSRVYQALKEQLPAYMIPSALVGLSSFPLTANGKLDRMKLLDEYANRTSARPTVSFESDTQTKVAQVWAAVLGHHDIRPDSSFFECGGTSLTVFQALRGLRDAFVLDRAQLTDQSFYQHPTLAELASCIDDVKSGKAPSAAQNSTLLVTLKKGDDATLAPFFVIASAGGTLGAYGKLAKALTTPREVIGVRDPFIWDERDPTIGFQAWIALYTAAIRERQPEGPYYLGAYSTAGAFGYEIAQHLRHAGQQVALLALVDPLALSRRSKRAFGYWALEAMWSRRPVRWAVRLVGWSRWPFVAWKRDGDRSEADNNAAVPLEEFQRRAAASRSNRDGIIAFSALLELNTGLPFALTESDFSHVEPDGYVSVLLARVQQVAPEVEPRTIENILVQYGCLQIPAQHAYTLHHYDGRVALFEPDGPHRGLLRALIRPHVRSLRYRRFRLGVPSERTRVVAQGLSRALHPHYLCMRDDEFVRQLAGELDALLRTPG
jgi:amino acid adenylation domain-containing protein